MTIMMMLLLFRNKNVTEEQVRHIFLYTNADIPCLICTPSFTMSLCLSSSSPCISYVSIQTLYSSFLHPSFPKAFFPNCSSRQQWISQWNSPACSDVIWRQPVFILLHSFVCISSCDNLFSPLGAAARAAWYSFLKKAMPTKWLQ